MKHDDVNTGIRKQYTDAASSCSSIPIRSACELPRSFNLVHQSGETQAGNMARISGSATELPDGISSPARRRLP